VLEDEAKALEEAERLNQEATDLRIRLLEAQGMEEAALTMRRAQELDAVDETNRWILLRIYALEDEAKALEDLKQSAADTFATLQRSVDAQKEAINATYDAQMEALNAQREAAQDAHDAQMEALNAQRDAAAESLAEVESLLSAIESAIDGFKLEGMEESAKSFEQSMNDIQRMARSPRLPDQDALDDALSGLSDFSPDDYATREAYEADYYATMGALEDLEKRMGAQKTVEERMLEALEQELELADAQYQAQMDAFDAQEEALTAWRDVQIQVLDDILEETQKQLDAINGVDTSILSVEEALKAFNEAVAQYNDADKLSQDRMIEELMRSAVLLEEINSKIVPESSQVLSASAAEPVDTSTMEGLLQRILDTLGRQEKQGEQVAANSRESSSTLKRWDMGGLPNERDSAYLEVI
jgi:hypothetical protein